MGRLLVGTLGAILLLSGCGSTSDTSTNSLSIAAPAMAITSPTQGTSTSTASLKSPSWIRSASLMVPGFAKLAALFGWSARASEDTGRPTELKPMSEMNTDAKADFNLPPAEVAAKFDGFDTIKDYRAPCFGPSWTDTASGAVARPGGDLGIVFATRNELSAEACAAAEMNALVAGKPHLFNKVRTLVTVLIAKANAEGEGLPAIGADVDVTMPTVTGLTFTTAKLSRLADDASGNAVYKTAMDGTVGSKTFSVTLFHSPTNADNTEFKGLFQAVMPYRETKSRALSVVYLQTAGVLTLALDAAANRDTVSTDFFNLTTGRVDFTNAASGEDLNKMIGQFDTATGASTVHFAWQAGGGDLASRDFAVTTTGLAEGATGIAYFGFGNPLKGGSPLTDSTTSIWASKMICDWLHNPSTSQPKLEKQTMTYNSGLFTPVTSKINFAPHTSCNNASWDVTVGPTFLRRTSIDTTANDLVAIASATDIPVVTAPTFTLP